VIILAGAGKLFSFQMNDGNFEFGNLLEQNKSSYKLGK